MINNKEENNFEYWIIQASNGRNVAECWQACYRISKETEDNYKKELIKEIEKEIKEESNLEILTGLSVALGIIKNK